MHKSEVAHLMQRIEEECQAMQRAMTGYAITSPHAFIHSRYLSIGAL
ncbi:MAG: hypothetical protein IMW89_20920 [Ktedonobacteraceae bacterium]|nr:hypothetical protein [Ktedonobacteraceae bacterium]